MNADSCPWKTPTDNRPRANLKDEDNFILSGGMPHDGRGVAHIFENILWFCDLKRAIPGGKETRTRSCIQHQLTSDRRLEQHCWHACPPSATSTATATAVSWPGCSTTQGTASTTHRTKATTTWSSSLNSCRIFLCTCLRLYSTCTPVECWKSGLVGRVAGCPVGWCFHCCAIVFIADKSCCWLPYQ